MKSVPRVSKAPSMVAARDQWREMTTTLGSKRSMEAYLTPRGETDLVHGRSSGRVDDFLEP